LFAEVALQNYAATFMPRFPTKKTFFARSIMEKVLRNIFENVLWPAAAGNVLWSVCSLFVDPVKPELGVCWRLIVLIVFSLYLAIGWLQLKTASGNLGIKLWFFEFLHISALAASAIAAQVRPDLLKSCLIGYFVITILGHATNTWKFSDGAKYRPWGLAIVNIIGVLVLVFGDKLGLSNELAVPVSFLSVFFLWISVSWQRLMPIAGKLQ
jgi:hypothetical protein